MVKWHKSVLTALEKHDFKVLSWRCGGHHDMLKISNGRLQFSICISQSPRSIEQATHNFRAQLKQMIRYGGKNGQSKQ